MNDITVVVCTFPSRAKMLARAVLSVATQTLPPQFVVIANDTAKAGAAVNRTNGLNQVTTEWTAFLDDDDELGPHHLEKLLACALEHDADMVFPWFSVSSNSRDPFPQHFGKEFDLDNPRQTTITMLVRTRAAWAVGGFDYEDDNDEDQFDDAGNRAGEDFRFVIRLARAGYKIKHLPERTWRWNHHAKNTSGLPGRRSSGPPPPSGPLPQPPLLPQEPKLPK